MGWESDDEIRFSLGPLHQDQMIVAQLKLAYKSLVTVPRGLQC